MSGLRKLGALVGGWNNHQPLRRRATTSDETAAELATVWERAVGHEIARRSRPTKLHAGILTVLTASSAWSDELTFLAPTILNALRAAVPQAQLRRLRFMVASGRTKALFDGARIRRKAQAGRGATPSGSAGARRESQIDEDVHVMAARLAATQSALDEARERAGWQRCRSCGRRFASLGQQVRLCAPCAQVLSQRRLGKIERALMQAPWLSAAQIGETFPDTPLAAYERTRARLQARWQCEIAAAERRLRRGSPTSQDRTVAWSYVMLITGLPEHRIGRAVVVELLGQQWSAALFDSRRAPAQARRTSRENYR